MIPIGTRISTGGLESGNGQSQAVGLDLSVLIETRLLITSTSGGGKSWMLRRLLEQTHGKIQQVVIDLEGEFTTLRSEFPFLLAGKDGDVNATPKIASMLARRILEQKSSIIIDLSELKLHDRIKFVRLFLESMMSAPKHLWHPVMVVLDEAHHFCPEKSKAESHAAVIDLCTRGRKRGFCAVLTTQRISKLSKDAAAELINVMVGRTHLDIDRKRSGDQLGMTHKTQMIDLGRLKPGTFLYYGPAFRLSDGQANHYGVEKMVVGSVKSHHPSPGKKSVIKPVEPTPAIREMMKSLSDLPEEVLQQEQTLESLKADNRQLRAEIRREKKTGNSPDVGRINQLQRQLEQYVSRGGRINELLDIGFSQLHSMESGAKQALAAFTELRNLVNKKTEPVSKSYRSITTDSVRSSLEGARNERRHMNPNSVLSAPQVKIINALGILGNIGISPARKPAVAAISGYSHTSGGFGNLLGKLKSMGFIHYPQAGYIEITDEGLSHVTDNRVFTSVEEIHAFWYELIPRPHADVLRVIVAAYPDDIARTEIAEEVGKSPTSGGFGNIFGRLNTLCAIEKTLSGRVKAADILFPEALR